MQRSAGQGRGASCPLPLVRVGGWWLGKGGGEWGCVAPPLAPFLFSSPPSFPPPPPHVAQGSVSWREDSDAGVHLRVAGRGGVVCEQRTTGGHGTRRSLPPALPPLPVGFQRAGGVPREPNGILVGARRCCSMFCLCCPFLLSSLPPPSPPPPAHARTHAQHNTHATR